jgi:hypothetical protein
MPSLKSLHKELNAKLQQRKQLNAEIQPAQEAVLVNAELLAFRILRRSFLQ